MGECVTVTWPLDDQEDFEKTSVLRSVTVAQRVMVSRVNGTSLLVGNGVRE